MLSDIFESAKQSLIERLTSPLLGGFAVAWCLWNWKFLVILFSDASVTQTFSLIEAKAFPGWKAAIIYGLLLPLTTAGAYIFIYPYPARFVHEFALRRQREIRQIQKRIDDETPLTVDDSRKLRAEYIEYERKNRELVANLNEEIARLNAALESAEKSAPPPAPAPKDYTSAQIEPSQLAVLQLMDKHGGRVPERNIIADSQESKVKTEFDIGELSQKNLINRIHVRANVGPELEFTHDGRRVLLNGGKLGP